MTKIFVVNVAVPGKLHHTQTWRKYRRLRMALNVAKRNRRAGYLVWITSEFSKNGTY